MPVSKRVRNIRLEFFRTFGFKPHGNNKEFKKLKGDRVFSSPKQRLDFLKDRIDDKKRGEPARIIQGALKRFTTQRKQYVDNFKKDLNDKFTIILKSSDIRRYSSINKIIEHIQNDIDMKKKNIGIKINDTHYTLSPENIKNIYQMVEEGGYLVENMVGISESDMKMVYDIITTSEIIITTYNKTNRNRFIGGAFFSYYLKDHININLNDLQIYKRDCDDKTRNLDNCLLYALRQYGIDDSKLEKIPTDVFDCL